MVSWLDAWVSDGMVVWLHSCLVHWLVCLVCMLCLTVHLDRVNLNSLAKRGIWRPAKEGYSTLVPYLLYYYKLYYNSSTLYICHDCKIFCLKILFYFSTLQVPLFVANSRFYLCSSFHYICHKCKIVFVLLHLSYLSSSNFQTDDHFLKCHLSCPLCDIDFKRKNVQVTKKHFSHSKFV